MHDAGGAALCQMPVNPGAGCGRGRLARDHTKGPVPIVWFAGHGGRAAGARARTARDRPGYRCTCTFGPGPPGPPVHVQSRAGIARAAVARANAGRDRPGYRCTCKYGRQAVSGPVARAVALFSGLARASSGWGRPGRYCTCTRGARWAGQGAAGGSCPTGPAPQRRPMGVLAPGHGPSCIRERPFCIALARLPTLCVIFLGALEYPALNLAGVQGADLRFLEKGARPLLGGPQKNHAQRSAGTRLVSRPAYLASSGPSPAACLALRAGPVPVVRSAGRGGRAAVARA